MTKNYNGHRSWNAWNVFLWLNNDYDIYRQIFIYLDKYGLTKTTNLIYSDLKGSKTPDGAIYNKLSIKLAIKGMIE